MHHILNIKYEDFEIKLMAPLKENKNKNKKKAVIYILGQHTVHKNISSENYMPNWKMIRSTYWLCHLRKL